METDAKSNPAVFPFTAEDTDFLEYLLFDVIGEDAPDLFGLHGLLTALCIHPGWDAVGVAVIEMVAGEQTLPAQQRSRLLDLMGVLATCIAGQLNSEEDFALPSEVYDDEEALLSWASGFMEGVFRYEDAWFAASIEERSAALLLPIMVHSGLYGSTELDALQQDPELLLSLLEQIPEVVIDLNLLLNTER